MKKRINVIIVIILFLIILCIGVNSFAFSNKEEVSKNQIFEYVISFEEPVITVDFSVLYDSNKLTYIGANTNELKINLNYDKSKILACYYDVNKIGTTNIVLKFKANTVGTTKINVENIIAHTKNEEKVIEISYKEINDVLGTNISKEDIVDVFRKLDFKTDVKDETVIVTVPTRRIDISIRADLIEEVGRIYGVDNIQGKLPVVPMKMGHLDKTARKIRAKMSNMGLNETLSYILINDKDVHKFTTDEFEEVRLLDPITEERNTLRYSIIPSLYKIYEYNKARENKDVCLFEIGKGFWKKGEEYGENQKICVLMTGKYYEGIGHNKNVDFYDIKGVTEELLDYLGYAGRYSFVLPKQMPVEFHPGQTAEISVNNDVVGIVGRIHPSVEKEAVYVMEINLDKLLAKRVGKMKFKEISKFPVVKKDLALLVDKNITSKEVEMLIKKKAGKLLLDINVFDVYEGKNIDSNKRSIAYSLTFGATDRTLNDDEINSILEGIITDLENKGFEIRK